MAHQILDNHKTIDQTTWERRDTFGWFKDFDFPYLVVGIDVDISAALPLWKDRGWSAYYCLIYAVCRAANAVPAFRQRIRGNDVVEHATVHTNFTVPHGTESFAIRVAAYVPDFAEFYASLKGATAPQEITASTTAKDHFVYLSVLPWMRFHHVVQPTTQKSSSIPRIIWGRFAESQGKTVCPFSVQVHHGLVDGVHMGRFFEALQGLLNDPTGTYGG